MSATVLGAIADAIAPAGLIVRGGFHAEPGDGVPPLPNGPARTVVLIGNAGADMWDALQASKPGPEQKTSCNVQRQENNVLTTHNSPTLPQASSCT